MRVMFVRALKTPPHKRDAQRRRSVLGQFLPRLLVTGAAEVPPKAAAGSFAIGRLRVDIL